MKRFCVIISLFLIGCASAMMGESKSVLERYKTVVFDDGISLDEAKLIAQRELIRQNEVAIYELANPQVAADVTDLSRYQDYWFVFFNERNIANIKYVFMAVINKKTGKVKFSQDYAEDTRWILEAAMLRGNIPGKL